MNKQSKYSLKTKISTIRSIKSGKESCRSAARRLGCAKSTVRDWILHYQERGLTGLNIHNGKYSGFFKVEVIQHMLKNKLSLLRTTILFGIPNVSVVWKWRQIYERSGKEGLLKENRGRKKSLMAKKNTPEKKAANNDSSAEKMAALQKEVEYLRAENAFLKKLDALIQQEEAVAAKNKRQKPSKN